MANATLITHAGASRVTREQLAGIAPPLSTPTHAPIGHGLLVDLLEDALNRAGYFIERQQYAVMRGGLMLFGVLDLRNGGSSAGEGTGLAVGFRHANNKAMSIKAVAGARVFVCDNLALSGDTVAFRVPHRPGVMAQLQASLAGYFNAFDQQTTVLRERFDTWKAANLTTRQAKALVYDAVVTGIIPSRLLDDVHVAYFKARDLGYEDCAPRTKWGLHNAFTRSFKTLNPAPAFSAQTGLTRLLG